MPDEVSAAIFMNAHILANNQSIAQQAPARVLSLIEEEADKSDGYWFREVVSYKAVKQNFFPVCMTRSSPLVCLSKHPHSVTAFLLQYVELTLAKV